MGVPCADPDDLATEAVAAFEELRERSQVISLLTGDREDPVRRASREMREPLLPLLPLLPLRDEVLGGDGLDDAEVQSLINEHRDARTELLRACQTRPGGTGDATGTNG